MSFTLVIDHRERMVTDVMHAILEKEKYRCIRHEIKELKKGDYAITYRPKPGDNPRLIAIIERKELCDYAASLKDGRHNNKEKLFEARRITGCKIYYLIEGDVLAPKTKKFGRIPYEFIESSITALMTRDGIFAIYTRDNMHTAERLFDLVLSYMRVYREENTVYLDRTFVGTEVSSDVAEATDVTTNNGTDEVIEAGDESNQGNQSNHSNDNTATLYESTEMTVAQMAMNMWQCIGGVAVTLSGELTKICPIYGSRDSDRVEAIQTLKYCNGRKVAQRTIDNINDFHRVIRKPLKQVGSAQMKLIKRVLCCINGIGPKTADTLLSTYNLYTLSTLTDEIIVAKIGKKGEKVLEALNYMYTPNVNEMDDKK